MTHDPAAASPDVETFVRNYSADGFGRIRFAWNGKHAAELVDANQAFRARMIAFVVDLPHPAPLILLRDLFLEEGAWCKEAWGCSPHFPALAEIVVKKCGVAFLDDFLKGMMMSFDTFGACHQMKLREFEIEEFAKAIEDRLAQEPEPGAQKLLESGRELFGKYRSGTAGKGLVYLPPGTPVLSVKEVKPSIGKRIQRWFAGKSK